MATFTIDDGGILDIEGLSYDEQEDITSALLEDYPVDSKVLSGKIDYEFWPEEARYMPVCWDIFRDHFAGELGILAAYRTAVDAGASKPVKLSAAESVEMWYGDFCSESADDTKEIAALYALHLILTGKTSPALPAPMRLDIRRALEGARQAGLFHGVPVDFPRTEDSLDDNASYFATEEESFRCARAVFDVTARITAVNALVLAAIGPEIDRFIKQMDAEYARDLG